MDGEVFLDGAAPTQLEFQTKLGEAVADGKTLVVDPRARIVITTGVDVVLADGKSLRIRGNGATMEVGRNSRGLTVRGRVGITQQVSAIGAVLPGDRRRFGDTILISQRASHVEALNLHTHRSPAFRGDRARTG